MESSSSEYVYLKDMLAPLLLKEKKAETKPEKDMKIKEDPPVLSIPSGTAYGLFSYITVPVSQYAKNVYDNAAYNMGLSDLKTLRCCALVGCILDAVFFGRK